MVNIITGDIDSGKTSKMIEIFNTAESGAGDGFISTKMFRNKVFLGYEIRRLCKNERTTLALLKSLFKNEFFECFEFDQFVFSVEGFRFGEEILLELLEDEAIKDIYIDEIGPIELEEKGFNSIFKKVLESGKNVFICVRASCLQKVIEKFGVTSYTLINIR